MNIKIAAYSDIHGILPEPVDCDLAIIGGDVCPDGQVIRQWTWIQQQFLPWLENFPHAVWVAGNHDFICEQSAWFVDYKNDLNHLYLEDQSHTFMIADHNLKIFGTPWSLPCGRWAFMENEDFIDRKLSALYLYKPDIIVSHGPPYMHGDKTTNNIYCGSTSLLRAIDTYQPLLVITGHIHEGRGVYHRGNTVIANTAMGWTKFNLTWTENCPRFVVDQDP